MMLHISFCINQKDQTIKKTSIDTIYNQYYIIFRLYYLFISSTFTHFGIQVVRRQSSQRSNESLGNNRSLF